MKLSTVLSALFMWCAIRLGREFQAPRGTPYEDKSFDLFIFGSSPVIRALVSTHQRYFQTHVRSLHLIQKTDVFPEEFKRFEDITLHVADCTDAVSFEKQLKKIVRDHATDEVPMHVFPTYDIVELESNNPKPRFSHDRDSLQINLNSKLQIIESFRTHSENTRFHLLGSLLGVFPSMGTYATSMWYLANVVADPDNYLYNQMDIVVHNFPGIKKKFPWREGQQVIGKSLVVDEIPTSEILKNGFSQRVKGIHTVYPSKLSKVVTFLGRRGFKLMDQAI